MKKRGKILVAAICCFVLGGAAFGGALTFGFLNREAWAAANANIAAKRGVYETPVQKEYPAENAVSAFDIGVRSADVEVKRGAVDTVRVEYDDRFDGEFTVTETDGSLKIRQNAPKTWFSLDIGWVLNIFDGNWDDGKVTVTVPEDAAEFDTIKLSASSGKIVCAGLSAETLNVSVSSGGVKIADGAFGKADLNAASGDISVSDVQAGGLAARSNSGKTQLTDVECGSFTGSSSSGNVALTSCAVKTVDFTVSSGNLTIDGLRGADAGNTAFDITVSSGGVKIFGERKGGRRYTNAPAVAEFSVKVKLSSGNFEIK
ncbi:hypothetical protein FACS1894211_06920 [Clostridia bacterium]|nr:hypothetical protein FACS1894211_06920 [Clostridia bacterium]